MSINFNKSIIGNYSPISSKGGRRRRIRSRTRRRNRSNKSRSRRNH